MKSKPELHWMWIVLFAALLLSLLCFIKTPAEAAGWTGSQTVTFEQDATIYTACIEYDFTDWWAVNITIDYHSIYEAAYDLSTTVYIPFDKHMYSTLGVRKSGKERPPNERGLVPYFSVTYQF
jgi:hypothetical protein